MSAVAQFRSCHAHALRAGVRIALRKHARAKRVGVAPQKKLKLTHYHNVEHLLHKCFLHLRSKCSTFRNAPQRIDLHSVA